jgi:hypothetical protein
MSYFQPNGFLLEKFHNPEYFNRASKLETIDECKPTSLHYLNNLYYKLISLELVK